MRQSIVVLGGLGDAYLMMALFEGLTRHYSGHEFELVIKSGHAAIAALFPNTRYRVDDDATFGAEANRDFQHSYDNRLFSGTAFYAHPCMRRTALHIDELPARARVCQADLFRMILDLPLDSPLSEPLPPPTDDAVPRSIMVVEANTWPDTQPGFYPRLIAALNAAGLTVWVNDKRLPLAQLFAWAARTECVIGPQCGLMSIFVTGQFPCRKILATPSIDGGRVPHYWARETFPYAYVTSFAGRDFDVEEYKIDDANHDELIGLIVSSCLNGRVHDPRPTMSVTMALTPGDALDRLAVLTTKRSRFSLERRLMIERDYQRHLEATRALRALPGIADLLLGLIANHAATFDVLERLVPAALAGGGIAEDHTLAIAANRDRTALKQRIDAICRSSTVEIKSYYGP